MAEGWGFHLEGEAVVSQLPFCEVTDQEEGYQELRDVHQDRKNPRRLSRQGLIVGKRPERCIDTNYDYRHYDCDATCFEDWRSSHFHRHYSLHS